MAVDARRKASLLTRLNNVLRQNPVWTDLAKSVDRVIDNRLTAPRDALSTVHDSQMYHRGNWIDAPDGTRTIINHIEIQPDGTVIYYVQAANSDATYTITAGTNFKDRTILVNNADYHGLSYYSNTLSDSDYALINDWVEYYWPTSGTQSLVNFMGFIKHVRLFSDPLWTSEDGLIDIQGDGSDLTDPTGNDEYPFLEPFDPRINKMVTNGGNDYMTSHLQIRYDIIEYPDVNETDLVRLFYLLASIELVLQRIVHEINTDAIRVNTVVAGAIALHEATLLEKETFTSGIQRVVFEPNFGGLALREAALLSLSPEYLQALISSDTDPSSNGSVLPFGAL